MMASNKALMVKLRTIAKKRVRHTYVGPWGYESGDFEMTLDEFLDAVEQMFETEDKPKMVKHATYGDLIKLRDFDDFCSSDGDGVWATSTLQSNLSVWSVERPEWATHVMWFNK